MTSVENAKDREETEELELFLDLVEEEVGVGEGVEAGEDITLSLCVPCECLSFRLRNLLMVLMLGQVYQSKGGRSRLGCMYSGLLPDNPHKSASTV